MKLRLVSVVAVVSGCAVAVSLWLGLPKAVASGPQEKQAESGKYTYVGSKTCKKCHLKLYKSWEKTPSAKALESLKPDQAAEIKTKHDLDPKKDYSQDESCLKCHVTGFGQPDGYSIPDPSDREAVKKAEALEGTGCEACHGPGSGYVELFKEIQKSKRMYKQSELYAVGLNKMGADVCATCHNDKSPTYDASKKFDFEKEKKLTHEHQPLKQREG